MTLEILKIRCEQAGFEYAYDHFNRNVSPPHLIASSADTDNFGADNIVYSTSENIQLELTTYKRDLILEKKIETEILYDIYWNKKTTYIENEKVHNTSYFFAI